MSPTPDVRMSAEDQRCGSCLLMTGLLLLLVAVSMVARCAGPDLVPVGQMENGRGKMEEPRVWTGGER